MEYFQAAGSQPLKVTFITVIILLIMFLGVLGALNKYPSTLPCHWHLLKIHCSLCNFLQLFFVNQQEVAHITIISLYCC